MLLKTKLNFPPASILAGSANMILVLATSRGVVTAAAIPPKLTKKIQSISYNYKTNIIYLKQHHKQMIAMG